MSLRIHKHTHGAQQHWLLLLYLVNRVLLRLFSSSTSLYRASYNFLRWLCVNIQQCHTVNVQLMLRPWLTALLIIIVISRWFIPLSPEQFCNDFHYQQQESPADAVKPARRKSMQKLLQFDVFRFISPNSISPNCQCIASRGRPMFSQALGLYIWTQFEIRCLPIIKFLV